MSKQLVPVGEPKVDYLPSGGFCVTQEYAEFGDNYEENIKEINRLADKETYKLEKLEALNELETLRTYIQALRPSNLKIIEKQIGKIKDILEGK